MPIPGSVAEDGEAHEADDISISLDDRTNYIDRLSSSGQENCLDSKSSATTGTVSKNGKKKGTIFTCESCSKVGVL